MSKKVLVDDVYFKGMFSAKGTFQQGTTKERPINEIKHVTINLTHLLHHHHNCSCLNHVVSN